MAERPSRAAAGHSPPQRRPCLSPLDASQQLGLVPMEKGQRRDLEWAILISLFSGWGSWVVECLLTTCKMHV